jgi:hypothetical protein
LGGNIIKAPDDKNAMSPSSRPIQPSRLARRKIKAVIAAAKHGRDRIQLKAAAIPPTIEYSAAGIIGKRPTASSPNSREIHEAYLETDAQPEFVGLSSLEYSSVFCGIVSRTSMESVIVARQNL